MFQVVFKRFGQGGEFFRVLLHLSEVIFEQVALLFLGYGRGQRLDSLRSGLRAGLRSEVPAARRNVLTG